MCEAMIRCGRLVCGGCHHLFSVLDSLLVFFFKQKTAYEMRISDWSSDVCSSDLLLGEAVTDPFRRVTLLARRVTIRHQDIADPEIGRASCRERVCQYV